MSFEEWWNTKDYPARCKGNCKEAYEAGMKADVHTDNSNVIAELEKENALLKGRNEGFEQQIMGLLIKYEEVYKRFPDLKSAMDKAKVILKENAELKETLKTYNGCGDWDNDFHTCRVYLQHEELQAYIHQLTKAKELLKQFLEAKNGEDTYKAEWEAEQFLKDSEVEK